MIRVFLVEDHTVVAEGLRLILEQQPDIRVVGEARTAAEVRQVPKNLDCDVVLLDLSLPDRSGLDVLSELRVETPQIPVLVLSMLDENRFARRALAAGASGYLSKKAAAEQLVEAVRRVASGLRFVSATVADQLIAAIQGDRDAPVHELLSDREFEVFHALLSGKTVTETARALCISLKTVSTHKANIQRKLNVRNDVEMIRYGIEIGLIP